MARKAGVDPGYVDHLVELGILKPGNGDVFSAGDVRKARWIQSLERAGVPLDEMAAAVQRGALSFSFLEMSAFDRFAGLAGVTFQEVSESTGIPIELLMVVREAFGLSEPSAQDYVREGELSVISTVEHQVRQGFRPVVIERWLRVYADSLRRIAETEADWYRTEVVEPFFEAGLTEAEMLEAQGEFGSQMAPLTEQALLAIYRGQQEYVWTKDAVESIEGALESGGSVRAIASTAGGQLPRPLRFHSADRGRGRRGRSGPWRRDSGPWSVVRHRRMVGSRSSGLGTE